MKSMQSLFAAALAALVAAGFFAQRAAAAEHGSQGSMHAPAVAEAPLEEGLVKKVDKQAGKVTLAHGALANGMPAMTMVYRVKETSRIDALKEGRRIRFAAVQVDGAMTVVRFEPLN